MTPNRDNKTGRWIKGRVKPIRLCVFCREKERRIGRKFCSQKCMGLARRGKPTWMKGKKFTVGQKQKLIESHRGQKAWNEGKECPQLSGKNHWNWRGGITKLAVAIRRLPEYKRWRQKVFERDNWTCKKCNKRGGELEAHHKKSFELLLKKYHITTIQMAKNCKQLWEISVGETLCISCHTSTETFPKNLHCATVRTYGKKTVRSKQK
jgi:hypothetical protein